MVFQSYALYPHLSVAGNIGFGLRRSHRRTQLQQLQDSLHRATRNWPQALRIRSQREHWIEQRISEVAETLELDTLLVRRPKELSGGQKQRVALGRAIARQPSVFLMDEPLSNLDAKLRTGTRTQIVDLQRRLGTTTLYVTHDQVEAMTMADKIVVLDHGNIEQVGSPLDLYRAPDNLFVAGFIGAPKMNFLTGGEASRHNATTIGVRPEHVQISKSSGLWTGKVGVSEHLGSDTFLHVNVEGQQAPLTVRTDGEVQLNYGETIYLSPEEDKVHKFDNNGKAIR